MGVHLQMTRSRPYRKNDNAHVEQKNWSHVRHLLGYNRLEDPQLVKWINDLYQHEWSLYQNHFMPSQKLICKEKINSTYRRTYDKAKTAYERLFTFPCITAHARKKRKQQHLALNPFELKKGLRSN